MAGIRRKPYYALYLSDEQIRTPRFGVVWPSNNQLYRIRFPSPFAAAAAAADTPSIDGSSTTIAIATHRDDKKHSNYDIQEVRPSMIAVFRSQYRFVAGKCVE